MRSSRSDAYCFAIPLAREEYAKHILCSIVPIRLFAFKEFCFCSKKDRCGTIRNMRDTLDVNAGKNKTGYIILWFVGILLFAVLLAFLVMRKNNLRQTELAEQEKSEMIQQVTGEELFPSLYEDDKVEAEGVGDNDNGQMNESQQPEVLPSDTYVLPEKETVTFAFAGDVLLDESYAVMSTYRMNGSELEKCIDPALLEIMRGADVFMINNEFPFTDRGEAADGKAFTFRAQTENVQILHDMGVDIVSLANNHVYDYGEISLLDTLDTLERAGIPYVGAGRNLQEASKVVYYQNGDMKIGIVSATEIERFTTPDTKGATEDSPGTFRCFRNDDLEAVIRDAKQQCDFLIVYVHWGTESTDELDWSQPEQAESFSEAGADVIIGAHPHVLQEIGGVNDSLVFYSLGNYWFSSKTLDSCLVTLEIGEGGLVSAQFVPCMTEGSKTNMATDGESIRILNYMRSISETVSIDDQGYVTVP